MGRVADRLRQLAIELPPPKRPVANYLGCKRSGELFGEAGRHARTATGAAQLPFGAAVQLDMVLRVASGG